MNLTSQTVTTGLSATVRPEAPSANKGTVGSTVASAHPLADVIYSVKVTAAAINDLARLTLSSGVLSVIDGSPVFLRSGVDMQGNALPSCAKIYGIRMIVPATNSSYVVTSSGHSRLPQIYMDPGASVVLNFPSGILTSDGDLVEAYFPHAADSITIEVLGQTA